MKKFIAVLMCSIFVAFTAFADTPTEKAIGYDGGLSLRYNTDAGIGFQGIVGLGMRSLAADDTDTDLGLDIAGNVYKCLWEDDKANFNMFAGVGVMLDGTTTKDGDSNTDINIAVGFEPEVFLSDNLSISTKMGVAITLAGDRRGASDSGWTDIGTFGNMVGNAALHWYF